MRFPEIPQNVRAYFYRVVLASLAVAAVKGWIDPNEVDTWLGFAAAVLAVANTPTER